MIIKSQANHKLISILQMSKIFLLKLLDFDILFSVVTNRQANVINIIILVNYSLSILLRTRKSIQWSFSVKPFVHDRH